MNNTLTQLLTVFLLAFLSLGATAEVYKWIDSSGRVHYSDKPDGDDLEILRIDSKPTDKAALAAALQAKADDEIAKNAVRIQQRAIDIEEEENEEIRQENCRRATEAVNSLRNAERLYLPSANGERRYLSEEEIAARISRAETDRARWCGESEGEG